MPTAAGTGQHPATADDVRRILGDLEPGKLLDIMRLQPSILDVEKASMWLAGDPDVFGRGMPLQPVAGDIVAILTADEDDQSQRAG
jgi:hypothetical protein